MSENSELNFAGLIHEEIKTVPPQATREQAFHALYKENLFGLAISGGGIRSATFALGIIQFLAQIGLLSKLKYLSTVSGGGYIGSWLSAWINRTSMGHVEAALVPPAKIPPKPCEDKTITWLRQYGKYLAPETSLFSADTWLLASVWSRNTFLNFILLMLYLSASLFLPWTLLELYQSSKGISPLWALGAGGIGTLFAILGINRFRGKEEILGKLSGFSISIAAAFHVFAARSTPGLWEIGFGAALGLAIGLVMVKDLPPSYGKPIRVILSGVVGAVGIYEVQCLVYIASNAVTNSGNQFLLPIFGPQIITLLYCLLVTLLIGIAGRRQPDEHREWWSRAGAWVHIFGLGGLLLAGIAVVGPAVFFFVYAQGSLLAATGSIWALATAGGVLLARSSSTAGNETSKRPMLDLVLPLIPPIFLTGFLILVATGVFYILHPGAPPTLTYESCTANCAKVFIVPSFAENWQTIWKHYAQLVLLSNPPSMPLAGFGLAALLFYILSRLFDINEFSLHQLYRNRLVRAYQGASNTNRKEQVDQFTNLDPEDDLRLSELRKNSLIHLVNCAVNLNLAQTGLDERRAASFVFTPYGCGYTSPSHQGEYYRKFLKKDEDLRLGTPITISGAAASPNMGFHTSSTLAFLMTLFNVRLGYWFYNTKPGVTRLSDFIRNLPLPKSLSKLPEDWRPTGPRIGTLYYLAELLAIANGNRKYVYLSDGGHFENLAVYELLRRRCKYIICIDGEEDPGMKFSGLGGLILKARSDMGIEITIDIANIEERDADGWSHRHCAVAKIQYPESKEATATLLYLKLSVTGDESIDVLHYRKLNAVFPHQSTGDQFFSESQFESYRELGYHVAETTFRPIEDANTKTVDVIFEQLEDFWTGIPRSLAAKFNTYREQLMALLKQLRDDEELWFLNSQFDKNWNIPAKAGAADIPTSDPQYTNAFYFCQQLLQLMKNAYVDLDLEANYQHPICKGYMEQFSRWAGSPMLDHTYEKTRDTFGPLFRNFYERRIRR